MYFLPMVKGHAHYGAQSFTNLMANLRPDINSVLHLAGALMEHFLEGIAPLRHWYISPNEKSYQVNLAKT